MAAVMTTPRLEPEPAVTPTVRLVRPRPVAGRGARSSAATRHVVQPGDTLWSVAERFAPGDDPRPVVDALAAERGSGPLVPGEVLVWAR